MTIADQHGAGVPGVPVDFIRTSDPVEFHTTTGASGAASYVFHMSEQQCETQTVTAVVRDPSDDAVVIAQLDVNVEFGTDACGGGHPQGGLDGWNVKRGDRDVLRVRAVVDELPISGAAVDLYRLKSGDWRQVGHRDRVLDAQGEAVFRVRDRNGRKKTAYKAVIGATETTEPGETQELTLR